MKNNYTMRFSILLMLLYGRICSGKVCDVGQFLSGEGQCIPCFPEDKTSSNRHCSDMCTKGYPYKRCRNSHSCGYYCTNETCSDLSETCVHDCAKGWYGFKCNVKCSPNCNGVCSNWDGKCTKRCKVGNECDLLKLGPNNGICSRFSGECLHGCNDGWFGNRCEHRCNNGCNNSKCYRVNGTCLSCTDGKFGLTCNRNCSGCGGEACDQFTGACSNGCSQTRYGRQCEKPCSNNCLGSECHTDQQGNVTCTNGCEDGWWGYYCQNQCPHYCQTCGVTGVCSQGCSQTRYGHRCNNTCSIFCLGSECHTDRQGNGKCTKGCEDGWWGYYCQNPCPDHCQTCGVTGVCSKGCSQTRYGRRCNKTCSIFCLDSACHTNGQGDVTCIHGCLDGRWGSYCQNQCPNNCRTCKDSKMCVHCSSHKHGFSCSETCSEGCVGQDCDMEGVCRQGCVHGWMGETCQTSTLWIIVPGCIAAVILTVSVIILLWRRKFGWKRNSENNNDLRLSQIRVSKESNCSDDNTLDRATSCTRRDYINPKDDSLADRYLLESGMKNTQHMYSVDNKVPLAEFGRYVSRLKETGEMIKQFNRLPINPDYPCYDGVLAKASDVILNKDIDDKSPDYISASYINGYAKERTFIATQGPSSETIGNFWTMVWQEDVSVIVMLTNCVEQDKRNCEQYWPTSGQVQMITPDMIVECLTETVEEDITIRTFSFTKDGHVTRVVKQFHFFMWPDNDVPGNVTSLLHLHTAVKSYTPSVVGPVVVHCSAGVGNTGTYIALDYLIQQAKVEGIVEVFDCVLQLRHQHMNLVQTEEQYSLIHDVLLQAIALLEDNGECRSSLICLHVETEESKV